MFHLSSVIWEASSALNTKGGDSQFYPCVCFPPEGHWPTIEHVSCQMSQSVKTLRGLGGLLESPLGLRVKPLWDLVPHHDVTGGRHLRQWVGVEAPGNASQDSTVGGGQLVSLWSFTVNADVLFYLPFKPPQSRMWTLESLKECAFLLQVKVYVLQGSRSEHIIHCAV